MDRDKRPLSVTILACIYIAVGAIGFGYYFNTAHARDTFPLSGVWIELVRLLAVICGVFMLRGYNWARWLALAWIGFHVIVSTFQSFPQFAIHCLFCVLFAWLLLRPESGRYFRGPADGLV